MIASAKPNLDTNPLLQPSNKYQGFQSQLETTSNLSALQSYTSQHNPTRELKTHTHTHCWPKWKVWDINPSNKLLVAMLFRINFQETDLA